MVSCHALTRVIRINVYTYRREVIVARSHLGRAVVGLRLRDGQQIRLSRFHFLTRIRIVSRGTINRSITMTCKQKHPPGCSGPGNCCSPHQSGYTYSVNHAPLRTLHDQVFGSTEGRIFSHQRRLGAKLLEKVYEHLKNAGFDESGKFHKNGIRHTFGDFDELHSEIEKNIRSINRVGDLAIYDISVRIGQHQIPPILPHQVYIHAGTKTGAEKALKRPINQEQLPVSAFADIPALNGMNALEIEDYLCINKDLFE